jgi:predicted AlkP superfamily pyrophosphatase or phosphodiesterase
LKRLVILNVVGLTPALLQHAPRLKELGQARPWTSPWPAVTCTSQATMLTGLAPREHGIVGNGWYYRDTAEIRFWQQSRSLVGGSMLYEGIRTAKLFWWFNQNAHVEWSVTPKPHYGCDGSKVFDVLDRTGCDLQRNLGPFPFPAFWGPTAGLASSEWIAKASSLVVRQNKPELTLVYLPHLDYDFQRLPDHSADRVAEVDRCAGMVIDAASDIGAQVVAVSEYGLVPVQRSIDINRRLRREGWLVVRDGPFGEQLMPGESTAFAVVDHQLAHVYVREPGFRGEVSRMLQAVDGIDRVVEPEALELDHRRSGDLIALAAPDAWFNYYYWLDDRRAPDFARTVDIHRKPGYDPVELFMASMPRAVLRLVQKKLGFRYRMDVIPLDPSLVRGSHGLHPDAADGPIVIGPSPPGDMRDFKEYVRGLIGPS